jgi:hypothetical protein
MAFFTPKVTHAKLTFSPFTSENMLNIGQATLDHMRQRIRSSMDVNDSRERPLNARYAQQKAKGRFVKLGGGRTYSGAPVRDWTLRGRTLQSLKAKSASENKVTIGPILQEAYMILIVRNRRDNMWGMSPSDREAMYAAVREVLTRKKLVQVETRLAA